MVGIFVLAATAGCTPPVPATGSTTSTSRPAQQIVDGADGVAGAPGLPGEDGQKGPQGILGPRGLQGVVGPGGPGGANGQDGVSGLPAVYLVGFVETETRDPNWHLLNPPVDDPRVFDCKLDHTQGGGGEPCPALAILDLPPGNWLITGSLNASFDASNVSARCEVWRVNPPAADVKLSETGLTTGFFHPPGGYVAAGSSVEQLAVATSAGDDVVLRCTVDFDRDQGGGFSLFGTLTALSVATFEVQTP